MVNTEDLIQNVLSDESGQSSFACSNCRRQKVRCDRILPSCGSCAKATRVCAYPLTVQKPGPKAGTHRRPRASLSDGHNLASPAKRARLDSKTSNGVGRPAQSSHERSDVSRLAQNLSHDRTGFGTPPREIHAPVRTANPLFRIVHPDHDPAVSRVTDSTEQSDPSHDFAAACASLGLSSVQGRELISSFFANMTAISLFHKPSFDKKLREIKPISHLTAFLSPMFAYSFRFVDLATFLRPGETSTASMLEKACKVQMECLAGCGDENPPFYLLQSLVLTTFQKLIMGVRGQAWRMLGDCIRIGYELRLSMIDVAALNSDISVGHDTRPETWVANEEKRRVWWALWEMDIFASTIRRLPASIDDRLNHTLLPSSDDDWFANKQARSAFLTPDAAQRWRSLANSENKSAAAWYIVINSYMFDSHKMGIFPEVFAAKMGFKLQDYRMNNPNDRKRMIPKMRDFLDNCLRCAQMHLPSELVSDNRFLAFRISNSSTAKSTRALDAGRYKIHIMIQLTRVMLFVWDVHHISATHQPIDQQSASPDEAKSTASSATPGYEVKTDRQIWQKYMDASNSIAEVIRNSSATHYQFVDPLMANAIWFAAAALVVTRLFGPTDILDQRSAASNFDLFVATLSKFESFWDVPSVLKQKLKNLEESIRQMTLHSRSGTRSPEPTTDKAEPRSFGDLSDLPSSSSVVNGTQQGDQSTVLANKLLSTGDIYSGFSGHDLSAQGFNFEDVPTIGAGQTDLLGPNLYDAFFDNNSFLGHETYNFNELFMYPHQ